MGHCFHQKHVTLLDLNETNAVGRMVHNMQRTKH